MKQQAPTESKLCAALRAIALRYPEAQEGTSCNKSAFKARNKAFLFLGGDGFSWSAMLKLFDSLAEAAKFAAKEPGCYKVGANGWVTATFRHDQSPPPGLLERWIDESYRLLVHKPLVAMLPERGPGTMGSIQTAKEKSEKKTPRFRRTKST